MRLRFLVSCLLVLVLAVTFFGCDRAPEPDPDPVTADASDAAETAVDTPAVEIPTPEIDPDRPVVALVNGYPAYQDDFESAKNALLNEYRQYYSQFGIDLNMIMTGADGRMLELSIEASALLQLVQLALTRQEAAIRGITIPDELIQDEFDRQYAAYLAQSGWGEEDLALMLAQQGRTLESFKESVREYVYNQLLAQEVQVAVAGELDLSEQELRDYYELNLPDYEAAQRIRASHILLGTRQEDLETYYADHMGAYEVDGATPPLAEIEDQIKADILVDAESVLAELQAGADFAEMAALHSTGPSGPNGGDLDWFTRATMVAPFSEAAFALATGELSNIVETEFGYHIILVTDRESTDFEALEETIRDDLLTELSYDRAVEWYDTVFKEATFDIENPIHEALIKQTTELESSIALLEQAQANETADEPYLAFILGNFYQRQMDLLIEEQSGMAAGADSESAQALDASIADYRQKALAAYQQAAEQFPDDPGVQTKIDELDPAAAEELDDAESDETP